MADKSKIEWTEATWNPVVGCSVVSPGCTNCYAMRFAGQCLDGNPKTPHYAGTTQSSKAGPVWTGKVALAPEKTLLQPLSWKRPRMIFVDSMGDLFHESVPDEWIDSIFAVMALCPQHVFQVLTKRAERMREYFGGCREGLIARKLIDDHLKAAAAGHYRDAWPVRSIGDDPDWPCGLGMKAWPLPNVWLGVSAEDQKRAAERIPHLLETPAAVRFVSAEPLLGPINFDRIHWEKANDHIYPLLDWIIVGGESGPNARPMHPDWARSIRDQCQAAGVPFFMKQWGEWAPEAEVGYHPRTANCRYGEFHDNGETWISSCLCREGDKGAQMFRVGKRAAGRLLDGCEHNGMPDRPPVLELLP